MGLGNLFLRINLNECFYILKAGAIIIAILIECYRKNSGNIASKYASKTLSEEVYKVYITFCYLTKNSVLTRKKAIPPWRPPKRDFQMY